MTVKREVIIVVGMDETWFDLALRYMRGDPTLTDVPYSDDSVVADFLRFWDQQTPHARSVVRAIFQAAPSFTVADRPPAPDAQSSLSQLMTDEDECIAREQAALEAGGTRMREVCVERIRGLMDHEVNGHRRGALLDAIRVIESLTLDQVEQEK